MSKHLNKKPEKEHITEQIKR